jgi:hypothetical protein
MTSGANPGVAIRGPAAGVGGPKVQPCSRRIFSTSLLPLHPSSCWLKSFPDNVRELLPRRLSGESDFRLSWNPPS